jgi:serine beta-lactamase-like protein LACTB
MIMSVEDLVRLGIALNHGRILKPQGLAEFYRTRYRVGSAPGSGQDYRQIFHGEPSDRETFDQGLVIVGSHDSFGRQWYGHSGGVKGTSTYFMNYPEQDVVVAVRANGGSGWSSQECAQSLAQFVLPGGTASIRPASQQGAKR